MLIKRVFMIAGLLALLAVSVNAAVITGAAGRNTTAPTGPLADSGWQYQGRWKNFLGTPIAPDYFITAGHIGGAVGNTFSYNGSSYTTTAFWDDPNSDLRIWQVNGTFDSYAPLYTDSDEAGKFSVLFGRGTQRGAEVAINNDLKGWLWGTDDHVQSWGTNTITQVSEGEPDTGDLLAYEFNVGQSNNEAHLTGGDSGGGLFINDNGTWKLAGINFAVSGPYSLSADGSASFNAALFDTGGLYVENEDDEWELVQDIAPNVPGVSFSTRISSNLDWINSVITAMPATTPEPSTGLVLLASSVAITSIRRRRA